MDNKDIIIDTIGVIVLTIFLAIAMFSSWKLLKI